jgi:hypothetical protein
MLRKKATVNEKAGGLTLNEKSCINGLQQHT